jgi:hypothetical protein
MPGGCIEDVDSRQFVQFETGNHLGPDHDPLRIGAEGLRNIPQPLRLVIGPSKLISC